MKREFGDDIPIDPPCLEKNEDVAREVHRYLSEKGYFSGLGFVVLQGEASSINRTYPGARGISRRLEEMGYRCLTFWQSTSANDRFVDLDFQETFKSDWRFSIEAVRMADAVYSMDSSLVHLAIATHPVDRAICVATYGPFPAHTRIPPGVESVVALELELDCQPCWTHDPGPCPESVAKISPCLKGIKEEEIVDRLLAILEHRS